MAWQLAPVRGADLAAVRRLAERYGARLAVSRPQVEAGRATRAELVGASSDTVAPRVYLALRRLRRAARTWSGWPGAARWLR